MSTGGTGYLSLPNTLGVNLLTQDHEIWPPETSNIALSYDAEISNRLGVAHRWYGQTDRRTEPLLAMTRSNDPR